MGTIVDQEPDPALYRRVAEPSPTPGSRIRGWRPRPGGPGRCTSDRITWDAHIHSVADIEALPFPPRMVNIKPSRFGSIRALRLLRPLREPASRLRRRPVRARHRPRADPVPGLALPPRRAERHRARAATTMPPGAGSRPARCRRSRRRSGFAGASDARGAAPGRMPGRRRLRRRARQRHGLGRSGADEPADRAAAEGDGLPMLHATLRCGPPGGSHPHPAAACAALARLAHPFAPKPAGVMCSTLYSGPQQAHVDGDIPRNQDRRPLSGGRTPARRSAGRNSGRCWRSAERAVAHGAAVALDHPGRGEGATPRSRRRGRRTPRSAACGSRVPRRGHRRAR